MFGKAKPSSAVYGVCDGARPYRAGSVAKLSTTWKLRERRHKKSAKRSPRVGSLGKVHASEQRRVLDRLEKSEKPRKETDAEPSKEAACKTS